MWEPTVTLNTTVPIEREEEKCPFKKVVRKRPRRRIRRNEDRIGFYSVRNHSFLNIDCEPRIGVNKGDTDTGLRELRVYPNRRQPGMFKCKAEG